MSTKQKPKPTTRRAGTPAWLINVRQIVGGTNPRNPLADSLRHYGVFEPVQEHLELPTLWSLATSDDAEKRAAFVQLMQEHDQEFCSWASTFIVQGQLQDVEVRENGKRRDGTASYTLVFGARRCLAILFNWCMTGRPSEPVVSAKLAKGSNLNLLHRAVVENQRKNPSKIEEARAIRFALNAGEDEATVCEQYGYSLATLKNRLALLDLPPAVQRKIEAKEMRPTEALAVATAERNGHDVEDKPKMLSRKKILEMREEYAADRLEYRVLSVVLGEREKVAD